MNKTINGDPGEAPPAAPPAEDATLDPRVTADMEILVKVAYAEKFGGFSRALNPVDRSWLWHAVDPATATEAMSEVSPPARIDQLPTVRNSLFALCPNMDMLCMNLSAIDPHGAQYLWSLQRMLAPGSPYKCMIVRVSDGKQGTILGGGSSDDTGVAVALAMLLSTTIDFPALHRELFPEKYLAEGLSG